MKKVAIGADIGGTNTAIGAVDRNGKVLFKTSIKTPQKSENPNGSEVISQKLLSEYISQLTDVINKAIETVKGINNDVEISGIGIGAPNGNYYSGSIEFAPNLPFVGIVNLVNLISGKFPNIPIIKLTNDANAAAIGEQIYGGAKEMKNFAMFTLGTGVGSGLVVNSELVYGHDGFAGECGHAMLVPNGRLCGCGAKGHLEAYCSASGMKRTAFELLAKYNTTDSPLSDKTFNEVDPKMIFDAAEAGDKIATEVFEITGAHLGMGLADIVHNLSPEAIFLFGGITAAGDLIFKPTVESMNEHLLPIFSKRNIQVLPSELPMGDAAIVGASALVFKEMEK
ncbi:MAG: ROK family protein [Bacteroidetes bacterium]|nr:ROK family protein [Bacteroidota bacterium]